MLYCLKDSMVYRPQVLEAIGKGEKSSFHFGDCCFFALGIFLVLTSASLFLALFFLEVQGALSGVSER